MPATPYAPPAAPVSDPAEPLLARPRTVQLASLCLWLSAGLGAVMSVAQILPMLALFRTGAVGLAPIVLGILTAVFTIALLAFVALKLNAGRGWVRWLFLAVWVLGTGILAVALVANPGAFAAIPPLAAAAETFQLAIQTAALVLMFVRPSREWFAARRKS